MYRFTLNTPQIMGILNVTPDSFSDGGAYLSPEAAVERAAAIEREGADILDIGAQSTRPGHAPVAPEEELRRLLPVLDALMGRIQIPVSVDTFYPQVAQAALARGAVIVNDVSGVVSREMAEVVTKFGAGWVLMHHGSGTVAEVRDNLRAMVDQAMGYGLAKEQLCVDPGIGFGTTREEDRARLAHTGEIKIEGMAYLVGASRKRVTGEGAPPEDRLAGTVAAHTIAQLGGADILRAHDVAAARQAAEVTKLCEIQWKIPPELH